MDTLFPFGFPASTARYLSLYVVTFALHQALVHYVIAGSLYATWATLFPGNQQSPRAAQPLAASLRDWLPFGLGAAITAGVAPLLFVQILYQRGFYTANLLLAWRWLIVIPVLGGAFYLLYLLKSTRSASWPRSVQCALALATTGALLFVGFCWTSNHLLSLREASWPDVYAGGELPWSGIEVLARLLVWVGGALATMSVIAGWQLSLGEPTDDGQLSVEMRRLATLALAGATLALVAGLMIAWRSAELSRVLWTPLAAPYVVLVLAGGGLQATAWVWGLCRAQLSRVLLATASVGVALALLGISVLRETIRLTSVDLGPLYDRHAEAAEVGGLLVFLLFAVVNLGLIGACIWLVHRGHDRRRKESEATNATQAGASPAAQPSGATTVAEKGVPSPS
jgi:hypothetical protein